MTHQPGDERRQMEIERGVQRVAAAKRKSDLSRYIEGKKVEITVALPGHPYGPGPGRVNIFYVDSVEIGHENEDADDYPSEVIMAKIGLAVAATVGTDGIPSGSTISPEERKRRDEYRKNVGAWRRAHGEE